MRVFCYSGFMMIRIFAMRAAGRNFTEARWLQYLSRERMAEAEKRKNERERQLFLGAEILMNQSLEAVGAGIPLPAAYVRNPYGKPCLLSDRGIKVNWSHSGEYVICAVADREIGIDLQYVQKEPKDSVIRKVLQPEELIFYEQTSAEQRKHLFYQYWTVKESYLKAVGTGFHTSLQTFYVRMETRNPKIIQREPGRRYRSRLLDFAAADYVAAVCCEGNTDLEPIEIQYL